MPSLHSGHYSPGPVGTLNHVDPSVSASNYYLVSRGRSHLHELLMHARTYTRARAHAHIEHLNLHGCLYLHVYPQRQHNIQVALRELKQVVSIPAGITSATIADGHREKTLALLWTIIFHFKV